MQADWLLAVGCSLTWGTEITEPGESHEADKLSAWPAHLATLMNIPTVINRGHPGRSNGSIYRVAVEEMAKCKELYGSNGLVVIQWSGESRLEFINPYKFDIKGFYKTELNQHAHPGQEGSYLCVTPNELSNIKMQQQFPGVYHFFANHWAYRDYQQELLINYSVSLTSIAEKLGINILQFNGVDEIDLEITPEHSKPVLSLIGKEFYNPTDRSSSFWHNVTGQFPRYRKFEASDNRMVKVPPHPTADQHKEWAGTLHTYLQTVYPTS